MISSTPRHCWKSGGVAAHIKVTRPSVCWARRVAKRRATADSLVLSITTRNFRGARLAGLLIGGDAGIMTGRRQEVSRVQIERCGAETLGQWVELRWSLWPDEDKEVMARESPAILTRPDMLVLVAREADAVIGFAEASVRRDYVNGCETRPVAFLEGI